MKINIGKYLVLAAASVVLVGARNATAQIAAPSTGGGSVTVVPGAEYRADGLKEKLLGKGWRDLWVNPVDAPVFDMGRYAGGLKVDRKGGGDQTLTLRFLERDGWREYIFRSVNKFPVGQAMPADIRGTLAGRIIQDQVSALFPAGALLMAPLLEATRVLHVKPELFVMPDDPQLGEHRKTFAGMLGTIELSQQEAPNGEPGFAGSRLIRGGDAFLEDVDSTRAHRLDEREFFAVRLVDLLVNDNDRTTDNIRFARFGNGAPYTWRPIPRDRDRVFGDARGLLMKFVIRPVYPKFVAFGPRYDFEGLTFESHILDRRLLQRLTRSDAEEIAQQVQRQIDDRVIEQVIAAMPARWRQETGADERLRSNLKTRRDMLPEVARDFYYWLATEVDIHGTDEEERALVERHTDGRVTVTVRGRNDSDADEPFSRRTFVPGETNEVRLYLHGGRDIAVVKGASNGAITVRLIGGSGDDVLADSAGGGATALYDSKGNNGFVTARGTSVSERDWKVPVQDGGVRFDAPWRPDWGAKTGFGPTADYAEGAGFVVGFGPRYQSYGFRRLPQKWKASADLLIGLGNLRPGVRAAADYRFENSPKAFTLAARATRYEAFRFYGYGNDVPRVRRDLAVVEHDLVAIEPRLVHHIGWRAREDIDSGLEGKDSARGKLRPLVGKLYTGPVLFWNRARPKTGSPFLAAQPDEVVGRAGGRAGVTLDQTSRGPVSDRGWTLAAELSGYPPLFDIEDFFGTASAVGAVYLPLGGNGTHVGVRVGGAAASNSRPVYHAPYIGGRSTVRGFSSHRFTGERSAFGSAELRVPTGIAVPVLVRWRVGVFGLADAGRVWLGGRSPGGWHSGYGGGLWFSSLGQALSIAFARGEENRIYLQRGLSF